MERVPKTYENKTIKKPALKNADVNCTGISCDLSMEVPWAFLCADFFRGYFSWILGTLFKGISIFHLTHAE